MQHTTSSLIQAASELLQQLSADEIRRRLDEIDTESKTLRTLLRSVVAKETAQRRKGARP